MQHLFFEPRSKAPRSGPGPAVQIHAAASPAVAPDATPDGTAWIRRRFVNDELNSRLVHPLPTGAWRVRKKAEVDPGFKPVCVLFAEHRVVLQGVGPWALYDRAGEKIETGEFDDAGVTLAPEHAALYVPDRAGTLSYHALADGDRARAIPLSRGRAFEELLIVPRERTLLVVSRERALDLHGEVVPEDSVVEIVKLPEKYSGEWETFAAGVVSDPVIACKELTICAAVHDDTLIVATPGRITHLDWALTVTTELTGDFAPIAMSVDELKRAYLLVDVAGRRRLWLVGADGQQFLDFELPEPFRAANQPPIVGYDHRVYVVVESAILCLESDGRLVWTRPMQTGTPGATISADNELLVSDGSEVVAFGKTGERRVLYDADKQPVCTPPVLTERGELLFATREKLFYLEHTT